MNAKLKAVLSHITLIGWIIAIVVNSGKKEEYASFYIRQTIGIYLGWFVLGIIASVPFLGWFICAIGSLILFIFWLMSLIWSASDEMKPIPWVGEMFQSWFRNL